MVLGLTLPQFTLLHVAISLIGIATGLAVLAQLLRSKTSGFWNGSFLISTALTSITGFLFPFHKFMPSHAVGILSLFALAVAIAALYLFHLRGGWRRTYIVFAVLSLYLNVFVLVVQSFLKIPALHELAPTGTEAPFAAAQLITLALFFFLGFRAFRKAALAAKTIV
jgi:hypothetical protein